jgi:hypothetical protein
MVKRVPEGPIFSRERVSFRLWCTVKHHTDDMYGQGNLRNLHSYKYSGLANAKVYLDPALLLYLPH